MSELDRQRAHYEAQNALEAQFEKGRAIAKNPIPAKQTGICPMCGRAAAQAKGKALSRGELDDAKRRALNLFDEWNDVAGRFDRGTGYYYEIQSVIEDAVECGAQAALHIREPIGRERNPKEKQT